jgi:hypothetical protein
MLVGLASLLAPTVAGAVEPGDLDPSFGSGGTVMMNFGGGAARAVAVDSWDRIVVGGSYFVVARYIGEGHVRGSATASPPDSLGVLPQRISPPRLLGSPLRKRHGRGV